MLMNGKGKILLHFFSAFFCFCSKYLGNRPNRQQDILSYART